MMFTIEKLQERGESHASLILYYCSSPIASTFFLKHILYSAMPSTFLLNGMEIRPTQYVLAAQDTPPKPVV